MSGNLSLWMEPESIKEYASKYGRTWARDFMSELESYGIQSILFDVKVPEGSLYFQSKETPEKLSPGFINFLSELKSEVGQSRISLYPRIVCFLDYSWNGEWSIDRDERPAIGKICPTNSDYKKYRICIAPFYNHPITGIFTRKRILLT